MKNLFGQYYVEVKDQRYRIHPIEIIILRKQNQPQSLRTQYQVQNDTQIRKNQEVIKNNNDELVVKNYAKNKRPVFHHQQQKFKPPDCSNCKQKNWLDSEKGYYCKNCEYIFNKQKHQIDKKKFVDKINVFQLDYHKLIKGLERYIILWLILLIFHQKI